jgi:hypothetical protein
VVQVQVRADHYRVDHYRVDQQAVRALCFL